MKLKQLLDRLSTVRSMSFIAKSARAEGWNGKGSGSVAVHSSSAGSITFTESGVWRPEGGRDLRFHNVFRWSVVEELLRLEHLRFGEEHPVYLFDLAPVGGEEWRSVSPHVCREDCYAAGLILQEGCILLRWAIDGPRKQETIEYNYYLATEVPHTKAVDASE